MALVRVLVAFVDAASRDAAVARHHAILRGSVGATGFDLLEVPAPSVWDAVFALSGEPGVAAAEPDARVSLRFAPNDPLFLTDPYTGLGQWGLRKTQVDRAWDVARGSPAITVATVDTGVDPAHPDLVGNLLPGPRFVSAPDPTCATDTTNKDDNGHGTHVAGIIGASGNNAQGIAGAAFGVRLLPIKALDCVGAGLTSDIAQGITYAADSGARVVNISLGSTLASLSLQSAVNYALSKNVVVVASAGNCGAESGTSRCPVLNAPDFPAAYPGVLAVGATDPNDQPTAFSTAQNYVGIAAPGTSIVSTFPTYHVQLNNEGVPQQPYAALRGTSQASPLVAGVAALLLSKEPSLSATAVVQRLRATADAVGAPGYNTKTGDGRVNALRALTSDTFRFGASYLVPDAPKTLAFSSTAALRVTATNTSNFPWPSGGVSPVRFSSHWYTTGGSLVAWDGPRASLSNDVPVNTAVTVDVPIAVPQQQQPYVVQVDLVQEGVAWFSSQGVAPLALSVTVNAGYGATYQTTQSALQLATGASPPSLSVTVMNTGTRTWPAGGATPVRLASHLRDAAGALLVWDGPRASLAADVAPGGFAMMALPLPVPASLGSYTLELDLVQDGLTWFSSQGVATRALPLVVSSGYGARYGTAPLPALLPGGRLTVPLTLTNTGAFTWSPSGANPVRVASHVLDASGNVVNWDGARSQLAADVGPNATAQATLVVDAPSLPGTYLVRVDLVREGLAWFSAQGAPSLEVALTVIADRRAVASLSVTSVSRSSPQPIIVTVTNPSAIALTPEGDAPVVVGSHWLALDGRILLWDGPRVALPRALLPAQQLTLSLPLAPPPGGAAFLVVDLVQEGVAWFGTGVAAPVTVTQ